LFSLIRKHIYSVIKVANIILLMVIAFLVFLLIFDYFQWKSPITIFYYICPAKEHCMVKIICYHKLCLCGPCSVVSIVTGYGLDGPGIESH
jgi:hypothetical protein